MSEAVEITHSEHENGGEYRATVSDSEHFGRMTWVKAGQDVRLVDHTIVPPAIGGRGIAARLVDAIVADAREQGFRIIPQCSYVAAQFRRHPEWADLLAN
ncbi:acetyltransferase [Croceicoccus estronivorus]|uniref:GNAT family N-acetyltransferase n=1 Tax=Croceicoccus estronivorus TaxID=1172626 RepID=UPI00082C9B0E|nr:GNAT family N-acetyltransferase [Croceicoccus estronivorus]OCC24057.1 acetyltransferase [Croceicoccus estronivorus]